MRIISCFLISNNRNVLSFLSKITIEISSFLCETKHFILIGRNSVLTISVQKYKAGVFLKIFIRFRFFQVHFLI